MSIGIPPDGALADRLVELERRARRLRDLVVVLALLAVAQIGARFLPSPSLVVAQRFVLKLPDGPPRAEFSLWADGTPAVRLNDAKGQARALWALRQDGTLSLRMTDAHFTTRAEMLVRVDGLPRVALYGSDGHSRVNLWVDEADRGRSSLAVP